MNSFLSMYLIGWAVGTASVPLMLKLAAGNNESRSQSAVMRSAWGSRDGRAAVIIVGFIVWPLYLVLTACYSVVAAAQRWAPEDKENES